MPNPLLKADALKDNPAEQIQDLQERLAELERFALTSQDIVATKIDCSGDIYTEEWTDYSATSTIVGWSSFTNKELRYKRVGNLVFVAYRILGAGNSTSISFTLPYNATAGARFGHKPSRTRDNGTWMAGQPHGRIIAGSNGMTFFKSESDSAAGSWSSGTGNRVIVGSFWYEAE